MRALLFGLVLAVAACGGPANTAYIPVGSRCVVSSDCGTAPYQCSTTGFPGGYCDKPCAVDAECPTDSICPPVGHCRRRCTVDSDCRVSEGYTCQDSNGGTARMCAH